MVSLQYHNVLYTGFFRLDACGQSCRAAAYYDQIVCILHIYVPFPYLFYLSPVSRFEFPPAFVRARGDTFSSLANISIVLGEQNPA